jgi:DNA (cytosine-5)-methyltransferase 1
VSVLLPEHRERDVFSDWEKVGGVWLPPRMIEPAPPVGIDLFAGAGGFSLGFHQAGWHVIAASEWWPVAAETYLCNLGAPTTLIYVGETAAPDATKRERRVFDAHGGELITAAELFEIVQLPREQRAEDGFRPGGGCGVEHPCELFLLCDAHELTGDLILDLLGMEVGEVGCVFGGPPCQGFSKANKHVRATEARHDERNQLVFEFARLVCEIQPQTMVMENVPNIVNMVTPEGVSVVDALSLIFERGGMGEYNALRRSLLANAGAGAIVNGSKKPGRVREPEGAPEDVDEQLALEAS